MFIEFTETEQHHIDDIKREYAPRLIELLKQQEGAEDAEKQALLQKHSEVYEEYRKKLDKYLDDIQRKRFKAIKDQGTAAILEDAKRQAPLILEFLYEQEKKVSEQSEVTITSDIVMFKVNGTLYLKPGYASDCLQEELQLHIEALQGDTEALNELYGIIVKQLKICPFVGSNAAKYNDIPGQMSIFDYENFDFTKPKDHKKSPLKKAEAMGAITTLNGYLTTPSSKKYMYAFSSKINKYAYMINGGADLLQDIMKNNIDDEDTLEITEEHEKKLKKSAKEKPVNTFLVSAFYTAVRASETTTGTDPFDKDNRYTRVYLPKFCKELGIRLNNLDAETAKGMNITIYQDDDTSEKKQIEVVDSKNNNDFWTQMEEVQNYIGVLRENGYVKFVNIAGFNAETKILYLDFPYLEILQNEILNDPDRLKTAKHNKTKVLYEKNYTNELMHTSVVGERNKAGAAIAKILIDGVLQRGGEADEVLPQNKKKNYKGTDKKTHTYRKNCATIVNEIPAFKHRLENIKSPGTKTRSAAEKSILDQQNKALKNAFTAAYKILREQSDFYKYYVNAECNEIIPTMRQLKNTEVKITHQGTNPDYKKP